MALFLGSRESCEGPSDQQARSYERIITHRMRHAVERTQKRKDYAVSEAFHEEEVWSKLRHERNRDIPVLFGNNVRVFHRARVNEARGREAPSRSLRSVVIDGEYVVNVEHRAAATGNFTANTNQKKPKTPYMQSVETQYRYSNFEIPTDAVPALGIKREPMADYYPRSKWEEWILGKRKAHETTAKKQKHRRVRHHRISCRFHLRSTNPDARKLSSQLHFPRPVLVRSLNRVQHASSGTPLGSSKAVPLTEYFALPELIPERRQWRPGFVPFQQSTPTPTASEPATPNPSIAETSDLPQQIREFALPADSSREAFLTEVRSVGERCRTPNVSKFDLPVRPHSSLGVEFADCDCTPRSTDDEGSSSEDMSPRARKKFHNSTKYMEKSSFHADGKLRFWKRRFRLATVRGNSVLESVLAEREDERLLSGEDRSHLDIVTMNAEKAGEDWLISRTARCNTPTRGSVWHPVFLSMGDQERILARNRDLFVTFCDYVGRKFEIPSTQDDLNLLRAFRDHCIDVTQKEVSQHEAYISKEERRPPSRATERSHSRPSSRSSFMPPENPPSMLPPLGESKLMFSRKLLMSLLKRFGAYLVASHRHVHFLDFLRLRCEVGVKEFFTVLQGMADAEGWTMCSDVNALRLRLLTTGQRSSFQSVSGASFGTSPAVSFAAHSTSVLMS